MSTDGLGEIDTKWYWDLTKHIFRYAHWNAGNTTIVGHGVHTVNEGMLDFLLALPQLGLSVLDILWSLMVILGVATAVRAVDFVEIIRFYTTLLLNVNEAEGM